ncbi:hypothetical protein SAMN05216411_1147 [Nitrosospira multiformis]|nr:hypothetical protein SAMN05216411_1147 [Nitrosospira multiformis]
MMPRPMKPIFVLPVIPVAMRDRVSDYSPSLLVFCPDFRMSLSRSGVNFRCLTEMAGNTSLFISNFFSMVWSKSIIGRLEFSSTSRIKSTFWRIHPWSRMIAFQKYRSNSYRIIPGDTVPHTEALNAARIETGGASATHRSTRSNVNRAKTQA